MSNKNNVKSEVENMVKKFRLSVWKANAYGTCEYTIPVASLEEASLIWNVLSLDDLIEEKMGVAPDYMSTIMVEKWHPQLEEWVEAFEYDSDKAEFRKLCNQELVSHLRKVYAAGEDTKFETEVA